MTEAGRARVEIGWILDGRLEEVDREAVLAARSEVLEVLARELPAYDWSMPVLEHEFVQNPVEEPVTLLETGSLELSSHHWDLALVVTGADLRARYLSSAIGIASRPLGVALLSTFRIDPKLRHRDALRADRAEVMRQRVARYALYLVGRLTGLGPHGCPGNAMNLGEPGSPGNIEDPSHGARRRFDEEQRERLQEELARIADQRIEEEADAGRASQLVFHLRAAWRNRREIVANWRESRPWELPFRLGRLTTAGASALVVLMLTAESWEIAHQAPALTLAGMALLAIGATTAYVLLRQRLFTLHRALRPTEQIVVTRVSVALYVLTGLTVAYGLLFAASLLLGRLVFRPEFVAGWIGSNEPAAGWRSYAALSGLAASLAVLIGALGASFEGQNSIRHTAYVDEEI